MSTQQVTAPVPPCFAPTTKTERLVGIDFARGLALLGILLVNAMVFFGPLAGLMGPGYRTGRTTAERVASLLVLTLCMGKFISVFSMLFGYGLLGQLEKADAAGRSAIAFALRRLGVLAAIGLIHALGIWFGDILFFYATMGFWLLLVRGARARTMVVVAVGLMLFALASMSLFSVLAVVFPEFGNSPMASPEDLRGFEAMKKADFNPGSQIWIAAEIAAYRDGPWADAQLFRTVEWGFNVVIMTILMGWHVLAMFFLGGALWRVRFFAPEQERLRRRVLWTCLPLGLALEGATGWLAWAYPESDHVAAGVGQVVQQIALCFLPLGYLALFALLAERLPDWLRLPIASAGRMSLTVYLAESLLATALAYHWGFRLFGRINPAWQSLVALAIWLVLVVASHLWLARFRQGPMEWLWRRLEYGRGA